MRQSLRSGVSIRSLLLMLKLWPLNPLTPPIEIGGVEDDQYIGSQKRYPDAERPQAGKLPEGPDQGQAEAPEPQDRHVSRIAWIARAAEYAAVGVKVTHHGSHEHVEDGILDGQLPDKL